MAGYMFLFTLLIDILGIIAVLGTEDYSTPRYYVLNLTQTTWHDSQAICRESGGTLATLYDFSTMPDLNLSHVMQETDGLIWVGLQTSELGWVWDTGENLTWNNWMDARPRGCGAVSVQAPYMWSSSGCGKQRPFLCEYDGGECRYEAFEDRSIAANNYMYLYRKSVEECKATCSASTKVTCQSFEYWREEGTCQFNLGNRWKLAEYYAPHEGWTYYHRTCNTANVTGQLTELTKPSPSPTPTPTSTVVMSTPIECSERFITKDIFVTHNVFVSQTRTVPLTTTIPLTMTVPLTKTVPLTSTVPFTQTVPVTQHVYVTHDVTETSTVNTTITHTETQMVTSTHIITPSPVFIWPSPSLELDEPIEEVIKEISEAVQKKKKMMKKISIKDDRPSATYVGYVAIAFLSSVFGSILLFDLLTICRNVPYYKKKSKKNMYKPKSVQKNFDDINKNNNHTSKTVKKNVDFQRAHLETGSPRDSHEDGCSLEQPRIRSERAAGRLWKVQNWSVEDSGFDGSGNASEAASSENNSWDYPPGLSNESQSEHLETVQVDVETHDESVDNTSENVNSVNSDPGQLEHQIGDIELEASTGFDVSRDIVSELDTSTTREQNKKSTNAPNDTWL